MQTVHDIGNVYEFYLGPRFSVCFPLLDRGWAFRRDQGNCPEQKGVQKESSNRRFDYIGLIVNVVSRLKTVFLFA